LWLGADYVVTIIRAACIALTIALVLITPPVLLSGCSAEAPATTSAPSAGSGTSATSRPPSTQTVSTLPASGEYGQQLRETAQAVAQLGEELEKKGAADPDLTAQVYALRARGQAITAARALVDQDTVLADQAVSQLGKLLMQAKAAAGPRWASVIQEAGSRADPLIVPSTDPAAARKQLDAISQLLAPLMPSDGTTPTT